MDAPDIFEGRGDSMEQPGDDRNAISEIDAPPHKLIGFFEHFEVGRFIGGWAGDAGDPRCTTLRVTALVDGKAIASTTPQDVRSDTPHLGFRIAFPYPQLPKLILEKRLVIRVSRDGVEPAALMVLPGVIGLARSLESLQSIDLGPVVPAGDGPERAAESGPDYLPLPFGLRSPDGAVIVGREGFLFRYRGVTDHVDQYREDQEAHARRDASLWFTWFRARHALLARRGVAYIQIVLPERATIMGDLAPPGLGPITPRLAVLEAMIEAMLRKQGPEAAPWYRSLVGTLRSCHATGVAPFLRVDSHLRGIGAQLVFSQLLQKMASLVPDKGDELWRVINLYDHAGPMRKCDPSTGDLAAHFTFPIFEAELLPDLAAIQDLAIGPPDLARVPVEGDVGTRMMWSNPKAPCSLKAMVFGSAAFGGGRSPHDLSWWFKAIFAEYHFVWSPEIDVGLIDRHRPDIVICQGVEEMLPKPPGQHAAMS